MAKVNVGIPQGTRDFGPDIVRKRNYIFDSIRTVFELYGFQPLETPAMENLETLLGKYGDEGDKLMFKILNNGLSDPKNSSSAKLAFDSVLSGKSDKNLTERALKYDLTIPFARYVAMNHGQLSFPFKRYQMQPVWRADRPQKGRYREFYQCDADVVGSRALINEIELTHIYNEVFAKLQIPVSININSRKLLAALAELCGGTDKMTSITIAIDKLDKIGLEKVKDELLAGGLNADQISIIEKYLSITGSKQEKLQQIKELFGENQTALAGISEIEAVINDNSLSSYAENINVDFTLARGLNYYTGIIFEVKAKNVSMGSIGGGGRYDDLTGLFGVADIPGVGISFGVDRIYDVMEELKLFPQSVYKGTFALFLNLGDASGKFAFRLMQNVRANGIPCEIYPEIAKRQKQFKYAESKGIPFVVIIEDDDMTSGHCAVKNIINGQLDDVMQEKLLEHLAYMKTFTILHK